MEISFGTPTFFPPQFLHRPRTSLAADVDGSVAAAGLGRISPQERAHRSSPTRRLRLALSAACTAIPVVCSPPSFSQHAVVFLVA